VTHPPVVPAGFWATDQLRDALDSWHLGRVISAYRAHPFHGRVLRQEIVAGWMGITQAQLSRIENGPPVEDLGKLRQWASVLRIPGELLWFKVAKQPVGDGAGSVDEAPAIMFGAVDSAEIEDMNRRDLLRLVGVAGAALATPMLSPADAAQASAEGALAASADQHGALNGQLWRLYESAQVKASVLPLVRSQLDVLTTRISAARTTASRQRLSSHLADLLQLAGEISFDSNHYVDAANCYALAAAASKEAEHYDMWACSLIRASFLPLYDRAFGNALHTLEAATSIAHRGDRQLPTRQWASTVTAQAHAGLGDLAACQKALDQAETVHDLTPATHTTGWLRFAGSRLAEERGTCLVELREYEQAEVSLTEALGRGSSGRRTGSIATDLAMVGARLGDVDRVTTYAGQAVAAAQRTQSGYVVKKLTGLQPHLEPLSGNRAIRDLGEQITHLSTTVATA
jgi:tetratricopeptide (TPR) repeat protein